MMASAFARQDNSKKRNAPPWRCLPLPGVFLRAAPALPTAASALKVRPVIAGQTFSANHARWITARSAERSGARVCSRRRARRGRDRQGPAAANKAPDAANKAPPRPAKPSGG